MFEGIASWLLSFLMDYFMKKAKAAIVEKAEQLKHDRERGEINEENLKAYEKAVERKERIDAALSLLNGDRP